MYNYDHKIQYNNISEPLKNETYHQDILTCFAIKDLVIKGFEINEKNYKTISNMQNQLFEKYKENQSFNKLMNYIQNNQTFIPSKLPLKTCFILCFSFDYFLIFHSCLVDLYNDNNISDVNYNYMIKLIKK
jgi:hypothetical protein